MPKIIKLSWFIFLSLTILSVNGFSQAKNKRDVTEKRAAARLAMHRRDSLMRSLNKSDTSINSLLQKIEQYTTTFNQIKNSLSKGLDTLEISKQLPSVIRRIDKISNVANTHKSSTLRYLFVLRDNLDRTQDQLEDWQADMQEINAKLAQGEHDLLKFSKDTLLKSNPTDSLLRNAFFVQRKEIGILWRKIDAANRQALLKVNFMQDKIDVAYTRTLDESDQIDN